MNPMNEELYDLLIQSLDQNLTPAENQRLEQALADSEELRTERDRLIAMRASLEEYPYQFKPFFVGRVMHQLEQLESPFASSWILAFRQIALPGLALLIALLFFTWMKDGSLSWEIFTGVSAFEQEELLTEYFTTSIDF